MFRLFSIELHSNIKVHYYRPLQTLDRSLLCSLVPRQRQEKQWISSARVLLLTPNEGHRYHVGRWGEGLAGFHLNSPSPGTSAECLHVALSHCVYGGSQGMKCLLCVMLPWAAEHWSELTCDPQATWVYSRVWVGLCGWDEEEKVSLLPLHSTQMCCSFVSALLLCAVVTDLL